MASRKKTPAPPRRPTAGKRQPAGRRVPSTMIVPDDPARQAFVRGLLARGEAARRGPGGELPPGVTHEIVGMCESGLPIVKRRRFA